MLGQGIEEGLLGVAVVLEGLVIVHVVACQIGEDASGKRQPGDALLCHAVAAHLHECILAALVGHLSQQAVECDGVGRGHLRRHGFSVDIVADGAAQSALVAQSAKHVVEQGGDGGLAVCAGDSHQLQPACGIAIELGGQHACHVLRVRIEQVGDAWSRLLGQ